MTNVSLNGLAWDAFRKATLIAPRVASEANKVLKVRSWTSVRDAIGSAPGASPPRLGGRTGRDECDACVGKGQTKSGTRKEKLLVKSLSTPPSRAGRDVCGRKTVLVTLFLSYRWELTIPASLL